MSRLLRENVTMCRKAEAENLQPPCFLPIAIISASLFDFPFVQGCQRWCHPEEGRRIARLWDLYRVQKRSEGMRKFKKMGIQKRKKRRKIGRAVVRTSDRSELIKENKKDMEGERRRWNKWLFEATQNFRRGASEDFARKFAYSRISFSILTGRKRLEIMTVGRGGE